MLLIVTSRDAEGNQAAAEPATDEAKHEAEDPAERALLLINVGHASVAAVLALDSDGVIWPVARRVGASVSLHHDDGLRHHRLAWCHHGLAWCRHRLAWLLWRVLGLSHLSRGVLRLSCHQRLLLRGDLSFHHRFSSCLSVHRVFLYLQKLIL